MAPNLEPEVMNTPQTAALGAGKAQPVALEIAVTVNGARTVEGTDKREPFSETTLTVLVFATGAVIRLTAAVTTGQLLFLTNEKTKKEVVCQVVKSKSQASASGYVELQFTEAAPGFWGMRAPGVAANGAVQAGAKPLAAVNGPSDGLHAKLAEIRTKSVTAPVVPPAMPRVPLVEEQSATISENSKPAVTQSVPVPKGIKAAPVVPAQPPPNEVKIPTLTEFLTKATNGSETGSAEISKSGTTETVLTKKAKTEQEQTSQPQRSLTVALTGQEASASVRTTTAQVPALAAKENPAAGSYTFDFAAEEVKIPSWLEPLARNGANVPAAESSASDAKTAEKKSDATELFVAKHTESDSSAAHPASAEQKAVAETLHAAAAESSGYSDTKETVLTLSSEGPTPNFGSTLRLDSASSDEAAGTGRSNKGLILTLVAVLLLLAAAGAWYWFSNQTANAASGESVSVQPAVSETTGSSNNANAPADVNRSATVGATGSAANRVVPGLSALNPNNSNSASVASSLSKPSNTAVNNPSRDLPETQPEATQVRKPVMGKLHLAAPVVNRHSATPGNDSAEPDPQIGASGNPGADASGLSMLSSKGKQPTAPLPIGGDVKPARLLSAVAPIYPQMARSQRLSGDVVIDALIDANGRVTTMKVLSGPALLHQSAMDSLRQWKYQPATLNGQTMPMHLTVTVQFKIQ
jgi:TonB family protein